MEEPPYWGSRKARVLEAIVVYNIRDWNGLLEHIELNPDSLNMVLSELYSLENLLRKDDGTYWIREDIYQQNRAYFDSQQSSSELPVSKQPFYIST
jgi:hypothetical protein